MFKKEVDNLLTKKKDDEENKEFNTIRVSSKLNCWMYLCKIFIVLVYQNFDKVAVSNDFLVIKLDKKTFKRL